MQGNMLLETNRLEINLQSLRAILGLGGDGRFAIP